MRVPTFVAVLLAPVASAAQGPPAMTDVFLAPLRIRGTTVTVGRPVNVTARHGYDNQPAFAPDGLSLFYTSVRDDAQADIYRYDLATRRAQRITATDPESEYSAAVLASGDLAVIRVERDSTQRLWRVPRSSWGRPGVLGELLVPGVKPAGYFAFADTAHVALYVLGTPPTLQLVRLTDGRVDTIVARVGRSLHRRPRTGEITFVSKAYERDWWVMALDVTTRSLRPLARLRTGVEDYAWLPDGRLIAGEASGVWMADPATDAVWRKVGDFAASLSAISRVAISPRGDWIAVVAEPRPADRRTPGWRP